MYASAPASTAPTISASGCPSLRRIVSARDGGICRIRLMGGVLSIEQATCIANASKRFGNGIIELTNRANIQLRGIAPEHEADLIATLVQTGLGAASDQADEASNLLLSPLAGICPDALLDVRPLAHALLQRLREAGSMATAMGTRISGKDTEREQAAKAGLSPKFSIQLDGGESLAMLGHHHDIWFSALPHAFPLTTLSTSSLAPIALGQGNWFAFGIAGSPSTSAQQSEILGVVFSSLVPDLASALVTTFLTLRTGQESRMRDVVKRLGSPAVWQHASQLVDASLATDVPNTCPTGGASNNAEALHRRWMSANAALLAWRRAPVDIAGRFGAHEQAADVSQLLSTRPSATSASSPSAFSAPTTSASSASSASPSAFSTPTTSPSPTSPSAFSTLTTAPSSASASASSPSPASSSASPLTSSRVSSLQYVGGQAPLGRLRADDFLHMARLAQTFQRGAGSLRITPWQGVLLPDIAPLDVPQVQSSLGETGLIVSPLQPLGALVACTGNSGCIKGHADSKADAVALAARLNRPIAVHLSACERSCAAAHPMPFTLLAQPSGAYDLYQADHSLNPRFGRLIATNLTIDQAATYLNTLQDAASDLVTQAATPSSDVSMPHSSPPSSTHSSPHSFQHLSTLPSTDTLQKPHA